MKEVGEHKNWGIRLLLSTKNCTSRKRIIKNRVKNPKDLHNKWAKITIETKSICKTVARKMISTSSKIYIIVKPSCPLGHTIKCWPLFPPLLNLPCHCIYYCTCPIIQSCLLLCLVHMAFNTRWRPKGVSVYVFTFRNGTYYGWIDISADYNCPASIAQWYESSLWYVKFRVQGSLSVDQLLHIQALGSTKVRSTQKT